MEGQIKNKSRVEQALSQAQEVPMGVSKYSALELFKSRLQGIDQFNTEKKNLSDSNKKNQFSIWSDFSGIQKNQASIRDSIQEKYQTVFDGYRTAIKSQIEDELKLKYRINQSYENPKQNQVIQSPKSNIQKNAPELHTFGKKNQNKNSGSFDSQIQNLKPDIPKQGISLDALKNKPQIDIFSRAAWAQNRQQEQRPPPSFKSSNNFKLFSEDNPLSSISQNKQPNLFFNVNIQKKQDPSTNIFNKKKQSQDVSQPKPQEGIKLSLFGENKNTGLFSTPNPDIILEKQEKKEEAKKPSFSFNNQKLQIGSFGGKEEAKPFNLFNNNNLKPTENQQISQQSKPVQEKESTNIFGSNLSKISPFSSSFAPKTLLTPQNIQQKDSDANKPVDQKNSLTPQNNPPIHFGNKFTSEGLFQKKQEPFSVPTSPQKPINVEEPEKKSLQPAKLPANLFSFKAKQDQSSSNQSFFQMKPVPFNSEPKKQQKPQESPFAQKKQQSLIPKLNQQQGFGRKSPEELFGKAKNQSSSITPVSSMFKNAENSKPNPFQSISKGLTPSGSLFGNLSEGGLFKNSNPNSLFANQNKSTFTFSAKPQNPPSDDDNMDDDKEEQILKGEQQLTHDPSKSTGNYQYDEQNDYLFKETALKFKKGSGSLFENIAIVINKNEKNQLAINAVLKNSVTCFSGIYFPQTTEIVIGEGSNYSVLTVKKVVTIDKETNKPLLETLKIKFQDEKIGKKFVEILKEETPN